MQENSVIAAILVGLSTQSLSSEDALRVTNVTIGIIRHDDGDNFRVEARIKNPNDFAVFDVRAECDVIDRRGNSLRSFRVTVADAIRARGTRIIRSLDADWPEDGRFAHCVSSEAKRLPD
jgi:hypothetical protein